MSFSEWKKYKLSELFDIIGGGTPKTSVADYWNGDIPWLSVVDFGGGNKYVFDTEKKISLKGLQNSSTKILKKGQLIISARGTVGEIAMLKKEMAFNQSCYGLNAKDNTSNNFLYYLIKQNIIELKSKTHGAVFDTITRETFNHIEISLPPKETQTRIAQILSSLDNKIELNRQTNQTLEALAQTLFKEMCLPKGGELEDGWRVGKISEIGKVITGKTPSSNTPEHFGTKMPFVTPTDFKNYEKIILSAFRYLSEEGIKGLKSKVLPKSSVIVTCIGSDMGKVAINKVECITNQQINSIVSDEIYIDFFYYSLQNKYDLLRNMATGGSTMPMINKSQFEEIELIIPPGNVLENFKNIVDPLNSQIENNIQENQTLTSIRDSLLPRLMKGEINV